MTSCQKLPLIVSMPLLPLMSLCLCLLLLCDLSPLVPASSWSTCPPPPVRLSLSSHRRIGAEVLSEDLFFERLLAEVSSCSHCLLVAPPRLAHHRPHDESRLTDIYGLRDLTVQAKTAVRKETLLVLGMAGLAQTLRLQNIPWLMTAPAADGPTCFLIPEVRALLAPPGVAAIAAGSQRWWFLWQNPLSWATSALSTFRESQPGTLAEAASSENYFLSGLAAQSDFCWFSAVKSILTEEATSFTTSASPDPLLASTVTPAMHFTDKLRGEQPDARELRDRVDRQFLSQV